MIQNIKMRRDREPDTQPSLYKIPSNPRIYYDRLLKLQLIENRVAQHMGRRARRVSGEPGQTPVFGD